MGAKIRPLDTCKSDIVLVLIAQGDPSHSLLSVFASQPVRQPAGDVPELLACTGIWVSSYFCP